MRQTGRMVKTIWSAQAQMGAGISRSGRIGTAVWIGGPSRGVPAFQKVRSRVWPGRWRARMRLRRAWLVKGRPSIV
jgi:hypothetical protein